MQTPWWSGLDLRVLRHVRGLLRRRNLELTLVERRPSEPAAFAALDPLDAEDGAGLAVLGALAGPDKALVELMLEEAARDVDQALRDADQTARMPAQGGDEPAPEPPRRTSYQGIIGTSPAMREVFGLLARVAPADSTVLILGENGTGKELVARAIHDTSPRAGRPFVVANCSAFNDNLLDSELFGHKRGAFTGAHADKPGLFEIADTSTFFLDEIGDMSPALQVKILRVLQEGTFNRVGDTEAKRVDVRIIAATNRDLARMVAEGQFREDLYYRINVLPVDLPPLRERRDDIPLLVDAFLGKHKKRGKRLAPACASQMAAYPWPGNVRELENEIERLVVLAGEAPLIGPDLLSPRIRQWAPPTEAPAPAADPSGSLPAAVEALERQMIFASLRRHRGNKTRAAEELCVSRRNLIRLVQKYELEK